jgi:hypothetical protein
MKKKDLDLQELGIRRVVSQSYIGHIPSQKEKIALTIYNYGFWKGFAIALIIGLIIGGMF